MYSAVSDRLYKDVSRVRASQNMTMMTTMVGADGPVLMVVLS